jgi:hypothetical protein
MPARKRPSALVILLLFLGLSHASAAAQTTAALSPAGAKTWVGRYREFEDYLKTAALAGKPESLPVGVTAPKRIALAPGGPVEAIAWKAIRPGRSRGFYESYKSEIAAYELDKLLGLDMVPPYVERRIGGDLGAAAMWISGVKSFKDLGGVPAAPGSMLAKWNLELVRAKMFDNLIANTDPNLGNWLKDDAWNVILIDHSRCFTTTNDLTHEMTRVDRRLWAKMLALDEQALTAALGTWIGDDGVRALLRRRNRMKDVIERLVTRRGETAVFIDPPTS